MNSERYNEKIKALREHHEALLARRNEPIEWGNGIYEKYRFPILTAEHTPLEWRYDFSEQDNPYLMQRIMMNAVMNSGAIKLNGRTASINGVSGTNPSRCLKMSSLPRMFMTCA